MYFSSTSGMLQIHPINPAVPRRKIPGCFNFLIHHPFILHLNILLTACLPVRCCMGAGATEKIKQTEPVLQGLTA